MNDSSNSQPESVQSQHGSLAQLLVGLLIGGGVAAAAIGLNQQLRPAHKTPSVDSTMANVMETLTETPLPPTETSVSTHTPTPFSTNTPEQDVKPEFQSATQVIVSASQIQSQVSDSLLPVFDTNVLPPPPVEESLAVLEIPSGTPDEKIEATPEVPAATPEHEESSPATVPGKPTNTPTPATVIEPAPVPTSAFLVKARMAQSQAEKAQEAAEGKQADRYAVSEFQEGLRLYTLGLESMERERYQTATKRFGDSAGAFIRAGSAAERIHAAQAVRAQARELVDQARSLVEKRAYPQAEQSYLAYLQQVPQDAQISMEYGEMLTDRLSYSRGIQVLAQTLQMPSLLPVQRGRIYWRFAEGHRRAGNLQAAIQSIRLAIQFDPQNSGYINLLNQYQYEASERQRIQQQRQGYQQNLIQGLTGSVLDSLIH